MSVNDICPTHNRSTFCRETLVAALAIACVVFAQYPLLWSLFTQRIIGGVDGDAGLYVWLVKAFINDPIAALNFATPAFYPYPLSRGWSDNFLLPSAFVSVLVQCGLPFEIAYNTMFLGCIVLNGVATYHLCRALGLDRSPALVSGVLLANCSHLLGNLGHPQLLHLFWAPWAVALVIGNRATSCTTSCATPWTRWLLTGLCITGAFYSAVYYAIFAVMAVGFVSLFSRRSVRALVVGATGTGVGMLPVVWGVLHYLPVKRAFAGRALYEAAAFAASGLSYFSFSALNDFFGSTALWTHPEATLAPGYCALVGIAILLLVESRRLPLWLSVSLFGFVVLAATSSSIIDNTNTSELLTCIGAWGVGLSALVLAARSPSTGTLLLVVCLWFFVLSLGPGGNPDKGEPAFAPFTVLHAAIPGLDSVRAVSRFGVIVVLGMFVGLGYGAQKLLNRLGTVAYVPIVILSFITLAENRQAALPLDPLRPTPEIFHALRTVSEKAPGAAIVLPFAGRLEKGAISSWTEFATLNTRVAIWSVGTTAALVNGYSGQRSKLMLELPRILEGFPSDTAFDRLLRICGLRYVVIIPELLLSADLSNIEARVSAYPHRVAIRARDDAGNLLLELLPVSTVGILRPETPVYAPRNASIFFDSTKPTQACSLSVSEWIRLPDGKVSRKQPEQLTLGQRLLSGDRANGLPFVFSMEFTTCHEPLSCRAEPAAD